MSAALACVGYGSPPFVALMLAAALGCVLSVAVQRVGDARQAIRIEPQEPEQ
jgi:hypothetical protein